MDTNGIVIVGLFILLMILGGFFTFRLIREQLYVLKLEILQTIRERKLLEKFTIKEDTRNISIHTRLLSGNGLPGGRRCLTLNSIFKT